MNPDKNGKNVTFVTRGSNCGMIPLSENESVAAPGHVTFRVTCFQLTELCTKSIIRIETIMVEFFEFSLFGRILRVVFMRRIS